MFASRWADDIRTQDKKFNRPSWHYINLPFKPESEPETVKAITAASPNILIALSENKQLTRDDPNAVNKAVALTWLFHLFGDIHQPLHTIQLFSKDYLSGDRGGSQICVRATERSKPIQLHALWDGLLTSSQNIATLVTIATALRARPEFSRNNLEELRNQIFDSWAKESYVIASQIAYQNGRRIGTPRAKKMDCPEVDDAAVLPVGYVQVARKIADRRVVLAGFRLADLLVSLFLR